MALRKINSILRRYSLWIVAGLCLFLIIEHLPSRSKPPKPVGFLLNKQSITERKTKRGTPQATIFHLKNFNIGNLNLAWSNKPSPKEEEYTDTPDCVHLEVPGSTSVICIRSVEEEDNISSDIRVNGSWKKNSLRRMANFFAANPNGQLVDIGCNIGEFSIYAADMGKSVLAVGSLPSDLALLKVSLFMNDIVEDKDGPILVDFIKQEMGKIVAKENLLGVITEPSSSSEYVTVLHNVISDSREQLKITLGKIEGRDTHYSILVDAICLDDLIPYIKPGQPPVFLKLDVEGAEAKVIQCASKFFKEVDVKVLTQTVPAHRTEKERKEIAAFLTNLQFVPFHDTIDRRILSLDEVMQWPDNIFWIKSWVDLHHIFGKEEEHAKEAPQKVIYQEDAGKKEEKAENGEPPSLQEIFGFKERKRPFG